MDVTGRALTLGCEALERGFGARPEPVHGGGSLPILAALVARGMPTLLSGLDLPDGNIHGPDERLHLEHLELGVAAARELFTAWEGLR